MGFFRDLFDQNARDIKNYQKKLQVINSLEPVMREKTDDELAAMTAEFRRRIEQGATPADLQAEAFAVAREAGARALGMRHYDVQMIGGMVLSDGRIAEMKTGEGKTLVATAPAYLHALFGKGVHVITVNDYLASRDSAWMGKLYGFLGLNTGLIIHDTKPEDKHAAYAADITYGTNNEFGFDYLRDNMCFTKERMVQRPLHYCIVDEVDSILIDEARTPLIISGPTAKPTQMYELAARLVPRLREEEDFTIDIKTRQVALVEEGVAKCEKALGVDNLYDPKNSVILHHVEQALRAEFIYKRDRDYVVKDGEVIIVDEFTGRLMFGRRYGEGLHQAIEAKEHVHVKRESQTFASITFQNYFRMYDILSGMTGTAKTEEGEFQKIYGFDVVEIPTNRPNVRKDHSDVIYRSEPGKYKAVVKEIKEEHEKGRPVLVGTVSIEKSELLSEMLRHQGVPHQVLNAKFHEQEAQIVSQAGRKGAVTIATNMAGRGTDILLGGNAEALAEQEMAKHPDREYTEEEYNALVQQFKAITDAEHDEVVALGGLHIIGTERHESRRIDNQLRGRAGRQGDPGSTRFYLSMQDDLVRRFGGDSMGSLMDKMGVDDSMPLEAALVSRSIENSQKRVEERNFEIRKSVLDYDDVMNQQRELIYSERRKALMDEDVHDSIIDMLETSVELVIGRYSGESEFPEEWDLPALLQEMKVYLPKGMPKLDDVKFLSHQEFIDLFKEKAVAYYESREEVMGKDTMKLLEHAAILQVVDSKWMDHLDAMDHLRQGIGLRAIGQRNPLIEYKKEGYDMFQAMVDEIRMEVSRLAINADLVERPREREGLSSNHDGSAPKKKMPLRRSTEEKVGRNDPCPCGSGKKYKNCCGKNA